MSKRYDWIDALKGFGAILVILGHLNPAMPIEQYIYSFHMPLFFFISGMLKKKQEQPLLSFIKKKAKSLLIPLIMWNTASTIILLMIGYDIEQLLNGMFFINKELPVNTPIWFLLNLFICEVIYEVLSSHQIPNIVIIGVSAAICPFICEQRILPFTLYVLPMSMIFYGLGVVLRPNMLKDKMTVIEKCAMPLLLVISILFGGILNKRISMANGYFNNMLYFMIAAVSGVILWTLIFRLLPAARILISIGQQSLFLMSWQYILFIVAAKISKKFFSYNVWYDVSTLKAAIATITVLLLSFAIIWIANRLGEKYAWIEQIAQWFGIQNENRKGKKVPVK